MSTPGFSELLNRYLEGKASDAEYRQLMMLVREGKHREELKAAVDAMYQAGEPLPDMDVHRAEAMLQNIVSESQETKVVKLSPRKWIAAAAVIALLAVASIYVTLSSKGDISLSKVIESEQSDKSAVAVVVGPKFVKLPDGSTVLLNTNSELSYTFTDTERNITLKGEGYFDVAHDESKPFKVLAGDVITTVLGTAFNISAKSGESVVKVTVTRGKVQVGDDKKIFGYITPNQQIAVNTVTHEFTQSNLRADFETKWTSRALIFDNMKLEDAAKKISERFNVKIVLANDAIRSCRFSAQFMSNESLKEVLDIVSSVAHATAVQEQTESGEIIVLRGEGCSE